MHLDQIRRGPEVWGHTGHHDHHLAGLDHPVPLEKLAWGVTPQSSAIRRRVGGSALKATTACSGRYFDIKRGVLPLSVKATMTFAPTLSAIWVAAWATAEATLFSSSTNSTGCTPRPDRVSSSTVWQIRAMARTVSSG
jgi:hypothetical protein